LANDTHKPIKTTDQDYFTVLKTQARIKKALIVLDGEGSAENTDLHDHDCHCSTLDVLSREELNQGMSKIAISTLGGLEADLLANFNLCSNEEVVTFI